jgi:NADPH2:quinone reductase
VGTAYGTAYHGLIDRAGAAAGETVFVHGATGGVGTAAVQLAAAAGMKVFASGGSESGRRQAAQQGASHVLDHHGPDYLDRLMELTAGRGVDVILEMLANVNLGKDLKVLAPNGRVVVIGSRGTVEINPRDAMQRNASILGMLLGSVSTDTLGRIHAALGAGFARGVLSPIVGRQYALADAPDAHRRIMEPGATGQIVLVP